MSTKNCYLPWPDKDDEPAMFEPIADAICNAIRFAYKMTRQNINKDIPWSGPNIGSEEKATCHQPIEQLSAKTLAYSLEDQGRDALDEIIGLALRLGIEQGRRILRSSLEYKMINISKNLNTEIQTNRIKRDVLQCKKLFKPITNLAKTQHLGDHEKLIVGISQQLLQRLDQIEYNIEKI
jgi:hypothetical protein